MTNLQEDLKVRDIGKQVFRLSILEYTDLTYDEIDEIYDNAIEHDLYFSQVVDEL